MDTYKLTYFNLKGPAEPIRLLFKYANVPFEDNQIDVTTWDDVKKDFKWHQVPVFEYNGKTLTQSDAIGKFLAKKFNLVPEDPWDEAKCEEIIGAVNDLRKYNQSYVQTKLSGDLDKAKEMKIPLMDDKVPLFLKNLSELLQELREINGNSEGRTDLILGGMKPTWADVCLAHYTDQWTDILEEPGLLEDYPLLKKHQESVYGLPGVRERIASRPKTLI